MTALYYTIPNYGSQGKRDEIGSYCSSMVASYLPTRRPPKFGYSWVIEQVQVRDKNKSYASSELKIGFQPHTVHVVNPHSSPAHHLRTLTRLGQRAHSPNSHRQS